MVKEVGDGPGWKFTGFYGHPEVAKRKESWALLRHLSSYMPLAWLSMGDFNEILNDEEKIGVCRQPRWQMEAFRDAIEGCRLDDLGAVGHKFTWSNGKKDIHFTMERLDQALANEEWQDLYPICRVETLATCASDHASVLISFTKTAPRRRRRKKIFRYESAGHKSKSHKEVIKQVWRVKQKNGEGRSKVMGKLEDCKNSLLQWKRENKNLSNDILKQTMEKILELQGEEEEWDFDEIRALKLKANDLMEEEELKWQQRAKADWLKHGDKNSKFFHACASQRRRANKISSIIDDEGAICDQDDSVAAAFISYFKGILSTSCPTGLEEALEFLPRRITAKMNADLERDLTFEEVSTALSQMAPLKSPGPNGFPAGFFQDNWTVVGNEVFLALKFFFSSEFINVEVNSTFIALVPKKPNSTKVSDFRPISLCNVLYKLLAKVLANRLKVILPNIVSSNQSAFISGRLISDNILVTYETLHTMHSRMYGRMGYMALKLDMSKAYGQVEWIFLEKVMGKMSFSEKWVNMVNFKPSRASQRCDTYLGLPALVGKTRVREFQFLKDKVKRRVSDWKTKLLSQAGKEVLLKAVVQGIPTYSMSIFLLPKELCKELNKMMQQFWWGHSKEAHKIHWMSWERMSMAKANGGMGFRDIVCFNKALLAKQSWRLMQNPDSLAAKVISAKYFPRGSYMTAKIRNKPSYAWRSILAGRELFQEGIFWRIGDGRSVSIWRDKWLPRLTTYSIQTPCRILPEEAKVAELLDTNPIQWKKALIRDIFSEVEAEIICNIPVSSYQLPDKMIWYPTNSGEFSVKSAYHIEKERQNRKNGEGSNQERGKEVWKTLWSFKDERGHVLVAKNQTIHAIHELVTGEALAALHAAEFCRELGFFEILLEGDSMLVVKAIGGNTQNWLKYGQIVEDTNMVLRSLRHWKIGHVKRKANEAAHVLAKEAVRTVTDNIWIEEISACIFNIVLLELNALFS
ncbi:uncharacterized protein LOC132187840 [Corylus avellana]|uniref:uncharacterized protein LOC132187840 n=1 Tax=Corylus avellana TaxID=13451 RepID=UPI00286B83E2|nr:uncharacterized protein LOC132187840 [Corylus avellana]